MTNPQTNPTLMKQERRWRLFGLWIITPAHAIGSSTITTVAVSSVAFIAGLSLPILIPFLAAIFIAEAAITIYLNKDSVPKTLIDLFVKKFFQDSEGKDLSLKQKIWLGSGFFTAISGGMAIGALTYMSIGKAMIVILGLAGLSFPPLGIALGIILGMVACVAFSGLLTRWIKNAVEENIHLQIGKYFQNLFIRTDKPLLQEILEKTFKIIFIIGIILLTIVGTIATLGTIEKGLNGVLSLIPSANSLATKIASSIMTFGLMGIARLPFVLTHVCKFFATLGEYIGKGIYNLVCAIGQGCFGYAPSVTTLVTNTPTTEKRIVGTAAKISALLVFSFSHGALAQSEGGAVITRILGDVNAPLSPDMLDNLGQNSSLISGALMASGIGGYTFFQSKENSKSVNDEKISEQKAPKEQCPDTPALK